MGTGEKKREGAPAEPLVPPRPPRRRWRRGQILVPSILIVPSLMLFIYLIFETTKLSREKIRQQFAVDSAAFIQMGDYTNILNRTAYVNGAFPYRIFKEAYECPPDKNGRTGGVDFLKKSDESGYECPYDMLYEAGAIPKYADDVARGPAVALDNISKWNIAFKDPQRSNMNKNPAEPEDEMTLFNSAQGIRVFLMWPTATEIYKFYSQVYALLGTVEESQMTVFTRLTDQFNFFRKSYYLNANTKECVDSPASCAEEGVSRFQRFQLDNQMRMHFIKRIVFHAKVPLQNDPSFRSYFQGKTTPPQDMTTCAGCNPKGLFQLATFSNDALRDLGKGYHVYQGWDIPDNYFSVDFKTQPGVACQETSGRACVHARIASQCPQLDSGNNCVWPSPTPKYQTRLYP